MTAADVVDQVMRDRAVLLAARRADAAAARAVASARQLARGPGRAGPVIPDVSGIRYPFAGPSWRPDRAAPFLRTGR